MFYWIKIIIFIHLRAFVNCRGDDELSFPISQLMFLPFIISSMFVELTSCIEYNKNPNKNQRSRNVQESKEQFENS